MELTIEALDTEIDLCISILEFKFNSFILFSPFTYIFMYFYIRI